jgi:hypothetical protein
MLRTLSLFFFAVLFTHATHAQDMRVLTFPDGGTIEYSDDWVITSDSDDFESGSIDLESDEKELYIYIYYVEARQLAKNRIATVRAFAEWDYTFYDASSVEDFNPDNYNERVVGGYTIGDYTFQDTDPDFPYDITVLYLLTPDGAGITIEATSYADIAVGDISSLYEMLASYTPPSEVSASDECTLTVPKGIILRAEPAISSLAVRTLDESETLLASRINLDTNSAPWYYLPDEDAYVRAIVTSDTSQGCAAIPQLR